MFEKFDQVEKSALQGFGFLLRAQQAWLITFFLGLFAPLFDVLRGRNRGFVLLAVAHHPAGIGLHHRCAPFFDSFFGHRYGFMHLFFQAILRSAGPKSFPRHRP